MNLEAIIAETKRPVLAAIRRYLDGRFSYAIDDVAQEVYLRAYRSLEKGKLREAAKIRSYLYTIAKNESLRMNGRLMREERKAEKFLVAEREKFSRTQDFVSDDTDKVQKVRVALNHLPPHYAQVVELTLAGLNHREIIEKLKIKPGTVKSRLSRGLSMLREALT